MARLWWGEVFDEHFEPLRFPAAAADASSVGTSSDGDAKLTRYRTQRLHQRLSAVSRERGPG